MIYQNRLIHIVSLFQNVFNQRGLAALLLFLVDADKINKNKSNNPELTV